jgi:hypothetical protein
MECREEYLRVQDTHTQLRIAPERCGLGLETLPMVRSRGASTGDRQRFDLAVSPRSIARSAARGENGSLPHKVGPSLGQYLG